MARARIAVARKLAAILHRMWADGTELRCGEDDAAGWMRQNVTVCLRYEQGPLQQALGECGYPCEPLPAMQLKNHPGAGQLYRVRWH